MDECKFFNNREEVFELINRADHFQVTNQLLMGFNVLKIERAPFFLNQEELQQILKWKLRGQLARQSAIREKNTDEIIQKITKTAFGIHHEDFEIETTFRLDVLKCLKGVQTAVASAILALSSPEKYGVIDFRNWRALYGLKKTNFSNADYLFYLKDISKLANIYGLNVQQIDMALWQKDIETHSRKRG